MSLRRHRLTCLSLAPKPMARDGKDWHSVTVLGANLLIPRSWVRVPPRSFEGRNFIGPLTALLAHCPVGQSLSTHPAA
jgi:hypothetical protein